MPRKRSSLPELNRTIAQVEAEIARRRRIAARVLALMRSAGLTVDDLATATRGGTTRSAPAPRRRRRRVAMPTRTKRAPTKKPAVRKGRSARVAAKYRHPSDGALTWTGRGSQPRWVRAWLSEGRGRKLDSLLITA